MRFLNGASQIPPAPPPPSKNERSLNIQLAKFISSCFDPRNILLSNQTNVT